MRSSALALVVMHQRIVVLLRDASVLSECLAYSLVTSHHSPLAQSPGQYSLLSAFSRSPVVSLSSMCASQEMVSAGMLGESHALPRPPGMCKGKCARVKEGTEMHPWAVCGKPALESSSFAGIVLHALL